jgi:hypothetical protein
MHKQSRDEIVAVVARTLTTVLPTLPAANPDTPLLGSTAVLDSVGFVTLLVSLEQDLGNGVELVTSFMELSSVAEQEHPFRTVASLSDHIHGRLVTP